VEQARSVASAGREGVAIIRVAAKAARGATVPALRGLRTSAAQCATLIAPYGLGLRSIAAPDSPDAPILALNRNRPTSSTSVLPPRGVSVNTNAAASRERHNNPRAWVARSSTKFQSAIVANARRARDIATAAATS